MSSSPEHDFWGRKFYGYEECCVNAFVKEGNAKSMQRFNKQIIDAIRKNSCPIELCYLMPRQILCSPNCEPSKLTLSGWHLAVERVDKEAADALENYNMRRLGVLNALTTKQTKVNFN